MLKVQSYLCGEWQPLGANPQIVHDAATNQPVAAIGHDGLPVAAMLDYAKCKGGTALRALSFHERAKMIKAVALHLMERKQPLYSLSSHTGATKSDSQIDIDGGIQTMLVFASKGRRELPDSQVYVDGAVEELSRDGSFKGIHVATPRLGVAVHINAFNFPVWGMLEKLAPTWLAGMPVIVKPASQTAYLTAATVGLMLDSGLIPEGAIQMIAGSTDDLLDHLGSQDVVSFTGSAATASRLRAHPNILENSIRFIAEQDSLNATILAEDIAPHSADFDIFIKEIVRELTTKAGQKCTAIRRVLVPEACVEAVIAALRSRLSKISASDPRDANATMGALVSVAQCRDVYAQAQALATEAEIVYGQLPDDDSFTNGLFNPILFHCTDSDSARLVHSVEAFGPVATILGYRDSAHAIAIVNRGQGSLVTSIVTNSPTVARDFTYAIGPWHGRLYFNNTLSARAATGHGSPLPHLVHGGPGRAGGGEEMGGIRGVMHYMQRTAVQGHPDILTGITGRFTSNSSTTKLAKHPFTINYHQLQVGDTITTARRKVTLEDIEHFAHFTGDCFYAHMDERAAQANPFFPSRVAHGYLLLSFAAGLFVQPDPGPVLANTGLNDLKFLKPVVADDEIYVSLSVKRKTRRTDDYGEVRWHVEINNQSHERVAEYELLTMNAYQNPY